MSFTEDEVAYLRPYGDDAVQSGPRRTVHRHEP